MTFEIKTLENFNFFWIENPDFFPRKKFPNYSRKMVPNLDKTKTLEGKTVWRTRCQNLEFKIHDFDQKMPKKLVLLYLKIRFHVKFDVLVLCAGFFWKTTKYMYFVLAQKRAMYKYMYFVPKLKISVLHVPPERMQTCTNVHRHGHGYTLPPYESNQ